MGPLHSYALATRLAQVSDHPLSLNQGTLYPALVRLEINSHLQLLEDQYVAKGRDPEEARYAARRAFGGVEQIKEHQRDARSFRWLAGWPMDIKLGGRMLVKYPGLTIVGGFAMAFAIWVGLIVFQVFGS